MRQQMLGALLVLATLSLSGTASAGSTDESAWDGKKLFMRKTCMACHGRGGKKAILAYPNLAGQEQTYLYNQMNDIADGKRVSGPDPTGHPRTQGMKDIMHLTDKGQRKKIAQWLASEEPAPIKPPETPVDPANIAAGEELYQKLKCQTCHGKEGKKPTRGNPYVAGQKRDYLMLQMQELQEGIRKNGRSGTMKPFIKKASPEDMERLADYLSQVAR